MKGGPASLLILSQKFHRDWHAQALTSAGWTKAKSVAINGVFQGVLLPEGTQTLKLELKPHAFWLLVLIALAFQGLRARIRPLFASEGMSTK